MRFENDPATNEMYCFPIIRPRHRKPISFTVATCSLRGCYTHWYGGKTIACCKPAPCEPCKVNVKTVWAGHVLAYRHEDDQVCMVTFTLPVKEFFKGHDVDDGGIFSLSCRLVRMGGRETGPIACLYLGRDKGRTMLKTSVLETVLTRLYADNSNQREVILNDGSSPSPM
jgi:hypothetical protein